MCASAILLSRLQRVVFGTAAIGGLNSEVDGLEVVSPFDRNDLVPKYTVDGFSGAALKDFFRKRRKE
jgi:tRNA(Arg) A34 adenosine deaminase TadA